MRSSEKNNLVELKKSFPSLDDFEAKKLLGGYIGPDPLPTISSGPDTGGPDTGGPEAGDAPTSIGVTPGPSSGGGGYGYFGESDEDMGDAGWADWGEGDGGGGDSGEGSNPGGSEGNSDQNSDNPGSEDDDQGPHLKWINLGLIEGPQPFTLFNATNHTIYYKGEGSIEVTPLAPHTGTPDPIDGFNVAGEVIKLTDGYIFVIVTDSSYVTNYVGWFDIWFQETYGGHLYEWPDSDWLPLFESIINFP